MIKIVSADGISAKVYAYDHKNVMREMKDVVSVEINKIVPGEIIQATLVVTCVQLDMQAEEQEKIEGNKDSEIFDDEYGED